MNSRLPRDHVIKQRGPGLVTHIPLSWLDLDEACGRGVTLISALLIAGTRDNYEIHHRCGKYDHVEDQPEEERENIWESQWKPSSSQNGDIEVESRTADDDTGKGKEKATQEQGSSTSLAEHGQKRSSAVMAGAGGRPKKMKGRINIGPDGSLSGF